MKRHLCLVVALLIPSLMMVPMSVSQAEGFSFLGLFSSDLRQPNDHQSVKASVFVDVGASLIGKHIQVNWKIESPMDVAYFSVQKSDSKERFGFIGGLNINRTITASDAFEYTDLETPAKTSTRYRIKLVLTDGTILYSQIIPVRQESDIIAYPDPVTTTLTLSLPPHTNHPFTIQIFDHLGHPVKSIQSKLENTKQIQIEMGDIPQGLYIVLVQGERQKWHKRILKL